MKTSKKNSILNWLLMFSFVLQGTSVLPLTAYATENHTPQTPTTATIVATKIVCDSEADLPNWGAGGGDITSSTASTFLASHPNCHLQSGWKFQSAGASAGNPGDAVAIASSPWVTSPATNSSGVTTWTMPTATSSIGDRIWVREVTDSAYIPFTGVGTVASVSAELYCNNDVLNYDNYDYILNPVAGQTYHCIGFNVLKTPLPPPPACITKEEVSTAWSSTTINAGSEKTLQTILNESGYSLVSALSHQTKIESWKTAPTGGTTTVEVTLLSKNAGNTQGVGYYTGSNKATFVQLFAVPPAANGSTYTFDLPANTSFGIALDTYAGSLPHMMYATQNVLNVDAMKHSVVYYPVAGEYVVAFEDLPVASSDKDYNDLVVKLKMKDCGTPPPPPPPSPKCADGVDNDEDGMIDFPLDLGCGSLTDDDENNKPVITLRGANPIEVSLGGTYTEPSADVDDAEDGDIDAKLVITGTVNTAVAGAYTITYNATDSENLSADTKTRTVNVTIPVCTSNCGGNPPPVCTIDVVSDATNMIVEGGVAVPTYSANPAWTAIIPGATWIWKTFNVATPAQDEYTTFTKTFTIATIPTSATLIVAADNSYTVSLNSESIGADANEYNFSDGGKDTYNVASSLVVGENTLSFTVKNWGLSGSSAESNPAGLLYKLHIELSGETCVPPPPPSKECSDGKDNDGDGKIDFGADLGCSDTNDNSENDKPVITLRDTNPFQVMLGGTFTEPSADVDDAEDGDIDVKLVITGTVNTSILGTYTVTYNATDSQNLSADTKTRTVNVVSACSDGVNNDEDAFTDFPLDLGCDTPEDNDENTKPVITLSGANPLQITIGGVWSEPGFTANDAEDGDITVNVIVSGTVDTATLGTYTLSYNVSDSKNLPADTKTRIVKVVPVVTECNDGIDNDGDNSIDFNGAVLEGDMAFVPDAGCDTPEDNSENQAPVITVVGSDPLEVKLNTAFADPGRTATDPEDLDITANIVDGGSVNTAVLGTYVLTYNVTDSKGAPAVEKTRTVKVVTSCSDGRDNDADGLADYPLDLGCATPEDDSENARPVISLLGDVVMSIVAGGSYNEPSATVADTEDGDITTKLITFGTVDVNTVGAYTITYNATDSENLSAIEKSRTVNVTTPACTSNCGGGGSSTFDYWGCTNPLASNYNPLANKDDGSCQTGGGGSGPVTLSIMNERIASTGTTTVVVTWNTNIPATSRVVYGIEPVSSLGSAPLYGYSLSSATSTTLTTSHSVTVEGIPSAVSAYFRPVSSIDTQTVTGIELTRGGVLGESTECYYLKEYMRIGLNNNPVEVTKLQAFLRNYEGFNTLEVNGFFDLTTDKAVRAFQDKYASDVLTPWNLPANTGYVYYTTQKKINEIYCQRTFPLSATQLTEMASFRTAVASSGSGLPAVAFAPTPATVATAIVGGGSASGGADTTMGVVAGASTVAESNTSESDESDVKRVGKIALADLLATSPTVGERLSGTKTDPVVTVTPLGEDEVVAMNDNQAMMEELAMVGGGMEDSTKLSTMVIAVTSGLLLAILTLLAVLYFKRRKTEVIVEMGE